MKFRHLLVVGVVSAAFVMPQNLTAEKPRITEIPHAAEEGPAAHDEQIEQITREYRQKLADLEQAYKAEIEQVLAKYANETAPSTSPTEPLPTAGPSVAVFTQFKPNANLGGRHVLHILTSDGKSTLIPYQFFEQEHGNWRRVPGGINYTWKGRESSGSAFIKYNPSRRGYSHPNAQHDDLVNAHGNLVVGDTAFLLNRESSKDEADGEPE